MRVAAVALLLAVALMGCRQETDCEHDARIFYQRDMAYAHDPRIIALDVALGWDEHDARVHEEQIAKHNRAAFLKFCSA